MSGNNVRLCHYAAKAKDEDRHLTSPLPSGGTAEKGKLELATWKIIADCQICFLKILTTPRRASFLVLRGMVSPVSGER